MTAIDTNILVCAHRADFLAIVTHPRIFSPPTPCDRACDQVDAWMEAPALALLGEDHQYWPALRQSLMDGRIAGPAVHDARVATLCERHGVNELWTADRDFSRFGGITIRNPLIA